MSYWSAEEILLDLERPKRQWYSLREITSLVAQENKRRGGISDSFADEVRDTKEALISLQRTGFARHISGNRWELPASNQRIFGEGNEWVYLFFDKDESPTGASSVSTYKETYPCKIGTTADSPEKRVDDYIETRKRKGLRVPTAPPILALLLRTDSGELLERALHSALKFQGKHIKGDSEIEVFDTNVNDVISLYAMLMEDDPNSYLL